ncbi:MAG: hypothetical protein O3C65_11700 [Proteobacteria bacterium]|nr:hypothetical protein [Pseudomonadota bacterium]MDA1059342.1 hypothetical protein [Pseudomonadota bacterium]
MVGIARTLLNALPRVTHGARLHVVPKLATPIGREAIALGDTANEMRHIPGHALDRSGLCLLIVNAGVESIVVSEIGLMGRLGRPRVTMRDPLLHDAGDWPRHLEPGESVVAYFASTIKRHPVLPQVRRAFAADDDGRMFTASSPALHYFVREYAEYAAVRRVAGPRDGWASS